MAQYVAIKVGSQLIQKRHMLQLYQLFRPEAAIKSLWHDIDQASKMVLMRIKTDVALHNSSLSYTEKETVKLNRQKLFMNLPAERVWLYLKICRNMSKFDKDDFKMQISALEIEGIEDGYAKLIGDSPKQELIRDMYLHATT
ncbi:hypothetical protein MW887_003634 [Aspergillus wentii]|nr:hypothetical protein MW887_003634 [Aspergillus wentii]